MAYFGNFRLFFKILLSIPHFFLYMVISLSVNSIYRLAMRPGDFERAETMNAAKVQHYMGSQSSKWTMFKTAVAKVGAVGVREGDYVAISHYDIKDGSHWFLVTATERGPIDPVCLPDYQLESFVL